MYLICNIITILLTITLTRSECPPSDITYPCNCTEDDINGKTLYCHVFEDYNLTQVSVNISGYYDDLGEGKSFDLLNLDNEFITSIEENYFYDLSFNAIWIKDYSNILERIHENAFKSSTLSLKDLRLLVSGIFKIAPSPYNVFNLINSFNDLTNLVTNLPDIEIPEKTLNNINLRTITFRNLKTLNNNVFYNLKNVENISIHGDYDLIPSDAFVIENFNPDIDLNILFGYSYIDSNSFEANAFTNPNRTLHLEFQSNLHLNYLLEDIFGDLLHKTESTIKFGGYKAFYCNDCRLKWIIEDKEVLFPKLIDAECSGDMYFYNLTIDDLNNCTLNSEMCNSDGKYDGAYGISHWPPVREGEQSIANCNNGNGVAKWLCLADGKFDTKGPDVSQCSNMSPNGYPKPFSYIGFAILITYIIYHLLIV